MKCFAVLAVIAAVACVTNANVATKMMDFVPEQGRIISGQQAAVGQFPWQVAIRFSSNGINYSFCGGALISDQWVLTAGHCALGAKTFIISLGGTTHSGSEAGRVEVTTDTAIVHPNYSTWTLNNDIALVKLPKPVKLTANIQPIRLPSKGNQVGVGEQLTVSGWGKTSDASNTVANKLNFVNLKTISNSECAEVYGSSSIISSTLCCRGNPEHSTCNGDSGGPLVTYGSDGKATHVGVVSFVHINGCASGNPSGYVRTESFLDWIKDNSGVSY